jgi:signal transduction histidine kinase
MCVLGALLLAPGAARAQQAPAGADSLQALLAAATPQDSVNLLNALCWTYKYSDPPLARRYGQHAFTMADSMGYTKGMADALRRLGVIDYVQGHYPVALSNFLQALTLYDKLADTRGVAATNNNIGLIYFEQRNFNKALDHYRRSLDVRTQYNDREGMGICLNNIGEVYLKQGDYAKALETFESCTRLLEAIHYKEDIGRPYINIGEVNMALNRDAAALQYFFKALRASEAVGNLRTACRALHRISKAYQKAGRVAESDIYGERALALARKLGTREIVRDASLTLSENYTATGNTARALELHKLYAATKDSLLSEENNLKLAALESQMDLSKKQTEIDLLNKDRELQSTVAKSLIGLTVLLLLLAVVLGLFYRNKRRDAKILARQKGEIEATNERLNQTLTQLNETQSQLILSEKMAALGRLVSNVSHEINTPLGAIKASAGTLTEAGEWFRETLPPFLKDLSPEAQRAFERLVALGAATDLVNLSTRDERRIRRELELQLQTLQIQGAAEKATLLLQCGITDALSVASLLRLENIRPILENAAHFKGFGTSLENITNSVEKTRRVLFGLKAYTATGLSSRQSVDVQHTLGAALAQYASYLRQGVSVQLHYTAAAHVVGNAEELEQVWANIIYNALQAMNGKGVLEVGLREQQGQVEVTIANNGPPIAAAVLPRIFEPFFTTKKGGEGSGLGLYSCRRVVELHGGTIVVHSEAGRTAFVIGLPAAPMAKV